MNFINRLFERKKTLKKYQKGIAFYNKKKFVRAIEQFESMLTQKSFSGSFEYNLAKFYCSQAYRNIGIIQFARGENENALKSFNAALKYNPNHPDLNYFIGICLNNIGKFQEAIDSFDKLHKIDPENIPNKLKMAVIFYNLGMWDKAEKINRNILEKKPEYADVHFHLGLSLLSQGKASEAAVYFDKALKINPNYINAQLKLSIAQICIGQFDKAFENLKAILEIHPDYADVNYLLGILKGELKEIDAAIKYLRKAVTLSPKFKNAQVKLIICYCQTGQIDLAVKQIDEAAVFYQNDNRLSIIQKVIDKIIDASETETSNNYLSEQFEEIFGEEQLVKELVNEFSTYLDIMPSFSEMIALFSNSKYAKEDDSISELMIPLILEHIDKHPDWPDLFNSLGLQFLFRKKLLEAESAFQRAVELNPDYITARINLMKTLKEVGEFETAYQHGKILVSKNLPYPDVYYSLAEILLSLNQPDKALQYAKKVLELSPEMGTAHHLIAKIYQKLEKK
jgi:tetratricopeptide (TPR) repeat protein